MDYFECFFIFLFFNAIIQCNNNIFFKFQLHQEAKMIEACNSMISLYPNQTYPLEVLCSHYLQTGRTLGDTLKLSLYIIKMYGLGQIWHICYIRKTPEQNVTKTM